MIKFRAWDSKCKVIRDYDELKGLTLDAVDTSDFKLEHFTGLKDVNGKDIYEGDIVKSDLDQLFSVCFGEQTYEENYGDIFKFQGFNLCTGSGYPGAVDITYEVIGNVHANPELLEEKK